MTQLLTDTARDYAMTSDEHINMLRIAAAVDIFQGSAVGNLAGFARQLVANDKFQGFALKRGDNTGGADADVSVKTAQRGRIRLTLVALADTDLGADVFASDGNVFTLSATGNSPIGKITDVVNTNTNLAEVYFEAEMVMSPVDTLTSSA